ncbi:MAG: hypothetical protein HPY75_03855 [Actinobacteria bacterium]|nr:hypothetical protein [Actinomycetota bacterium]
MASVISGLCALLFVGLGLPLANRRVPPNSWYGYRVSRYQYEDEEIWYAINARGGAHTVFAGAFAAAYCGFALLFRGSARAQAVLTGIFTVLLLGWAAYEIWWSVREARRMAREKGLLSKRGAGGS